MPRFVSPRVSPRVRRAAEAARSSRLLTSSREPGALRVTARELGWIAAHVALYPTGISADRRLRRSVSGAEMGWATGAAKTATGDEVLLSDGTPILLLHGLVDNRSVFTRLRTSLARRGFACLLSMNYPVRTADIASAAEGLADVVEGICASTGYQRIHLVAHSMGGLIGRYYVQRLGGDARIHTLITVATPHEGTATARLMPYGVVRQLRPGSPILADLAGPSPNVRTRIVSIYSDRDALVVPASSGRLEHPDLDVVNVLVPGAGHHTLPFDKRTVEKIAGVLHHLDSEGDDQERNST